MILEEYLSKNLLTNSKKVNRIDISFELFQKIVVFSCIRSEIRHKFCGVKEKTDPIEPHSICAVLNDAQYAHYYEAKKLQDRDELFHEIDYYDDVCPGQRGFGRNLDRLCNQLIEFYIEKFPSQAQETLKRIEEIHKEIDEEDIEALRQRINNEGEQSAV